MSYLLGLLVIALGVTVLATPYRPDEVADWALDVFGVTFLVLLGGIVFGVLYCWTQLCRFRDDPVRRDFWVNTGLHGASGIATLALTYTLLGISLGIGSLADAKLSPDTIQDVISDLTRHFSLAFLTTVIGLPLSAAFRALLEITRGRLEVMATDHSSANNAPDTGGPSA